MTFVSVPPRTIRTNHMNLDMRARVVEIKIIGRYSIYVPCTILPSIVGTIPLE